MLDPEPREKTRKKRVAILAKIDRERLLADNLAEIAHLLELQSEAAAENAKSYVDYYQHEIDQLNQKRAELLKKPYQPKLF